MAVKEVNINGKVKRVVVVIEVNSAFALIIITFITNIIVPYCTRFRTIRLYIISKAIGKGIIVYRYDYILNSFNWY